jgi:hypothetical protein
MVIIGDGVCIVDPVAGGDISGHSDSAGLAGLGGLSGGVEVVGNERGGTGGAEFVSGSSLKAARTMERRPFDGLRPNNFSVRVRLRDRADEGAGDMSGCED